MARGPEEAQVADSEGLSGQKELCRGGQDVRYQPGAGAADREEFVTFEPGTRFNFLTFIEKVRTGPRTLWKCICICGNIKMLPPAAVYGGTTKSCGCKYKELLSASRTTHGHSKKDGSINFKTFICWQSMFWRCTNSSRRDYKDYGGRGIKVCDRWQKYENFLADMGPKPEGLTLDRKDTNGHYEPSNCRWATVKQQSNNRRSNRILEFSGRKLTVAAWAEEIGISHSTLLHRLGAGWSIEKTLTTKLRGSL